MNDQENPFVDHLLSLREDRGALAALRRGLGQPPGTVPSMFPYVERFLPRDVSRHYERACYLVAALFAYHPEVGGHGNMGGHFAQVRRSDPGGDDTALERRFTALLSAHDEDLPFYLRQAVSFLRSKEIPVNWHRLFSDVLQWRSEYRHIQKQWARSYWGHDQSTGEDGTTAT